MRVRVITPLDHDNVYYEPGSELDLASVAGLEGVVEVIEDDMPSVTVDVEVKKNEPKQRQPRDKKEKKEEKVETPVDTNPVNTDEVVETPENSVDSNPVVTDNE